MLSVFMHLKGFLNVSGLHPLCQWGYRSSKYRQKPLWLWKSYTGHHLHWRDEERVSVYINIATPRINTALSWKSIWDLLGHTQAESQWYYKLANLWEFTELSISFMQKQNQESLVFGDFFLQYLIFLEKCITFTR